MSSLNLAYAAGFIDGEGSISFHIVGKHDKCYAPSFNISNNSIEILAFLQSILGGKIYKKYLANKVKHTQSYILNFTSQESIKNALEKVTPFLRLKQKQARAMLKYLSIRNFKNHNRGKKQKNYSLSEEEFNIISQIKESNKELNKRVKAFK